MTLVFLGQHQLFLKYITTPAATAIASAQALRITRKLWKLDSQSTDEGLIFRTAQIDVENTRVRVETSHVGTLGPGGEFDGLETQLAKNVEIQMR